MNGELESVWTCMEEGGEPSTTTVSEFHQLSCHISTDVKYLQTGLLARLTVSALSHCVLGCGLVTLIIFKI